MILATILRIREDTVTPWNLQYYLCDHYKKIFDELGITLFPLFTDNSAEEACRVCDALILPGSDENIYPEYYGDERNPETVYKNDEYAYDKEIIDAFVKAKKPIFGICGGLQELNVFFGGKLNQKVDTALIDHTTGEDHDIRIEKDSFLYEVYGKEKISVNSYHSLAASVIAPGFKVTATAPDGTVEAIENGNIIAVQWHPEVTLDIKIFKLFFDKFLK